MTPIRILVNIGDLASGFDHRHGDMDRGGGLIIAVVLVVATALITWFIARRDSTSGLQSNGGAEEILAERLARSEVSIDDYRSTLAALREK
ncbi:hypothetical protein BH10ACT2_BH10ACT2_12530 [soil metagenome]